MDSTEREGYIFCGWYVDEARTRRINPGGRLPGTVHLYPKWEPILYPVYYDLEEGVNSEYNPHEVSVESKIFKLYPARSKGRQFVGWFRNGKRVEFLEEGIQEPVRLKGIFQDPIAVSFDSMGGTRVPARTVGADGRLDRLPAPFRIGYAFDGWYLDEKRTLRCPSDRQFHEPCTLYAGWHLSEYDIQYELNEGVFEREPIRTFTCATPTFALPIPVREGYDFEGWQDERGNPHLMIRTGSINSRRYIAVWKAKNDAVFMIASTHPSGMD